MAGQGRHRRSIARGSLVAAVAAFFAFFAMQAIAAQPEVAEIEEPALGAAPLNPADVHMVAEYEDADEDEHLCSNWEIRTAEGELVWHADCEEASGEARVHIHLGDGHFVNSLAGHTELEFDSEYVLRVRFKDDSGIEAEEWSAWAERPFSTVESGPQGKETADPWLARPGYRVEVFARGFQLPVNIAMVPDAGPDGGDPLMYVTELYGNVKVVTRDGTVRDYAHGLLNFNPTGNFPGSGEKGLTGIAVEPESGDVFVSLVYEKAEDGLHYPKVVRLISDDRGLEAVGQEDVVEFDSDPQGASHQISNLTIGPHDGALYVHNGDGLSTEEKAQDKGSFLGKILRVRLDGEPLSSNPFYTEDGEDMPEDYIWAYGFRNPFGGAWKLSDATHYTVENGPGKDRLALLEEGVNYQWPIDTDLTFRASYHWDPAHAPVNIEFVEPKRFGGSGFPPEAMNHAFVTESGSTYATGPATNGKRIAEFDLDHDGNLRGERTVLAEYQGTGKATAVGLAAGTDGLYFTDLYKDQNYETPIDRGAQVLRVVYCGAACPGAQPPGDAVAPLVKGFRVQRKSFAVGLSRRVARAAVARRGTVFRYWLSEPVQANIRIRLIARGWRVDRGSCGLLSERARTRLRRRHAVRRCILPYARGVRYGKRCRRGSWRRGPGARKRRRCVLRGPRGWIKSSGSAASNARPYAGRVGKGSRHPTLGTLVPTPPKRKLRPAHYLAIIHTRDAAGNPSAPSYTHFRVVRPKQKAGARRGRGRGA